MKEDVSMLQKSLVLASRSPRRSELLHNAGIFVRIVPADLLEAQQPHESPQEYALRNAREKAGLVDGDWVKKNLKDAVVLGSDTIVVLDNVVLEKPKDTNDAKNMLKKLSGKTHHVFTAYSLWQEQKELVTRCIDTQVTFRTLTDREIEDYVATGEPMDKSGSYGIQGRAAGFIQTIQGSYTTVMGLPLAEVLEDLKTLCDIHPWL